MNLFYIDYAAQVEVRVIEKINRPAVGEPVSGIDTILVDNLHVPDA